MLYFLKQIQVHIAKFSLPFLNIQGGPPKRPELSCRGWSPYSTGFPQLDEWFKSPSISVASWCCCEKLCLASEKIFWGLFQRICPFHNGRFMSTPAHTTLSVQQFLTKNSMTPVPHPPYSSSLTQSAFYFVSSDKKKVLKGNHFASVEEVNQKMAEALKGIKMNEFKTCFEQWKKMFQ